jgi:SAM-dependent methyltransferase
MALPRRSLCVLGAVGLLAVAAGSRQRIQHLAVLSDPDGDGPDPEGWGWLTARGVSIDDVTRRAACRHAVERHLDVVDLVPANLPTPRALELLRDADPKARQNPMAVGVSARQAIVARLDVLARAGLDPAVELDEPQMLGAAWELKKYCPTTTELAIAPRLRAGPEDQDRRRGLLTMKLDGLAPLATHGPVAGYLVLAAAVVLAPIWGAVALAAWCAGPLVTFAGTRLRPPDLLYRSLLRGISGPVDAIRTLRGRWRPGPDETGEPDPETLRGYYEQAVASGLDRFFEPRVASCPVCGGRQLTMEIVTPDRLQCKPGTFQLDRCQTCRTVFQNPRLSSEGLDYYYKDFYDGLGRRGVASLFGASADLYRERAAMLANMQPKRWLDVGTGYGHFCLTAREVLRDTTFDALDMSDNVTTAERQGWIETGHRGRLVELADQLAGSYDVVSMIHYLEHVTDPWAELDAAAKVLVPGGHVLIEVPDPDFRFESRLLRSFWHVWCQPQHLVMPPDERLVEALEARGFDVVELQRGECHIPGCFMAGVWLALNTLAPQPGLPWHPPATAAGRVRRATVMTAGVPLLGAAFAMDMALKPFIRRGGRANLYRVLARARRN